MAYQFHLAFHTRYFPYICQFILHFCRLLLWQLPSPISATQKIASWLGDHTEFKYNKKKKQTQKSFGQCSETSGKPNETLSVAHSYDGPQLLNCIPN